MITDQGKPGKPGHRNIGSSGGWIAGWTAGVCALDSGKRARRAATATLPIALLLLFIAPLLLFIALLPLPIALLPLPIALLPLPIALRMVARSEVAHARGRPRWRGGHRRPAAHVRGARWRTRAWQPVPRHRRLLMGAAASPSPISSLHLRYISAISPQVLMGAARTAGHVRACVRMGS